MKKKKLKKKILKCEKKLYKYRRLMYSINPPYKDLAKWFSSSDSFIYIKSLLENPCRACPSYDGDKSGGCSLSPNSDEKCSLLQDK